MYSVCRIIDVRQCDFFDHLRYVRPWHPAVRRRLDSGRLLLRPSVTTALDEDQAGCSPSFAALADPIRLRLLSFIASTEATRSAPATSLEPSGRSQPTVSHHMKILIDAGLVTREKRGLVWYRAVPSRLAVLRGVLA